MRTKKSILRIPRRLRKHLKALVDLMDYANSRDDGKWAWGGSTPSDRDGPYGFARHAMVAIIKEEFGESVGNDFSNLFELGVNGGLGDVEAALEKVDEILRELGKYGPYGS